MERVRLVRRLRGAAWLGLGAGVVALLLQSAVEGPRPPRAALPETLAQAAPRPVVREVAPPSPARALPLHRAPSGPVAAGPATPAPPRGAAWSVPAGRIDVRAAHVVDGRLVQALDDGTAVELTLDPVLQFAAQRSLERFRVEYGAVVAVRPATGEVLALAEHAEGRPDLRHLALQGEGPAASIFKLVTAATLIEKAGLGPDASLCSHGGHKKLTLYHLKDNPKLDTKCETLVEAFANSSNVAFARWADRLLEPTDLQAMADRFLFNRRLPFLWGVGMSQARIPTGSRLGLARAAAGFEGTTLSPLHAALLAATVAQGGEMMAPRLVARATRGDEVLYEAEQARLARVLSPSVARTLASVMTATTETGTAAKFFRGKGGPRFPGLAIAAKTGHLSSRDAGASRHYSWFVAYFPAEAPEVAVAGLVVNGEQWTTKGVVPVRDVIEAWYQRRGDVAGR